MKYLITLVMPPNPKAVVLDPFAGSGTTILAAKQLNRNAIGIELSPEYAEIARNRVSSFEIPLEQYELAL
jgi:site-specific DNA-methyltransferase (adenine-specific)